MLVGAINELLDALEQQPGAPCAELDRAFLDKAGDAVCHFGKLAACFEGDPTKPTAIALNNFIRPLLGRLGLQCPNDRTKGNGEPYNDVL